MSFLTDLAAKAKEALTPAPAAPPAQIPAKVPKGSVQQPYESPPPTQTEAYAAPPGVPTTPGTAQQVALGDLKAGTNLDAGNSSKIQADRLAKYTEDRQAQVTQAVKSPPQPAAFQSLRTGPDVDVEYEPTQVPQVETSEALLRRLSPFMLQVEPPLAFGEDGGFLARKGNSVCLDTFSSAMRTYTGYEASRAAVAQSGLVAGINTQVSSVQEFIQSNSMNAAARKQGAPAKDKQSPDLASSNLGEPAIADLLTAADIAWQLSGAMQVPPLVLLINPQTVQISYNKIQQFQERTRYGFVFHAWGEEQPKLSITARCGAFASGYRGVQAVSKRDSLSWQNLMNAFHFYRNNGYIYDTIGKSNAHHFVGAISIHYDQWVYYGHMESFNWTYEETNQLGGVEFTMEFTVSAMVDTAQQTFVVTPMKSPIPSASDSRYIGLENRSRNLPGEYAVGFNDDGTPRLSTQGHVVTGNDFAQLVPGGLEPLLEKAGWTKPPGGGTTGKPISYKGFQTSGSNTSSLPGQRTVNVSSAQNAGPFGVR